MPEMRTVGEHRFEPLVDSQQGMNQHVALYGLKTTLHNWFSTAEALNVDPEQIILEILGHGVTAPATEEPERKVKGQRRTQEPTAPEPEHYNRRGKVITEARHNGGLTAWDTRRAIDAMLAANPRLSRMSALALYRDENPRSRAKNLSGPRNNPTKGESSWDTRLRNIIKKHHAATGKTLSWEEAHDKALVVLQGHQQTSQRRVA